MKTDFKFYSLTKTSDWLRHNFRVRLLKQMALISFALACISRQLTYVTFTLQLVDYAKYWGIITDNIHRREIKIMNTVDHRS